MVESASEKRPTKHYQTNGAQSCKAVIEEALDTPIGTMAPHIRLGHLNTVLHTSPFDSRENDDSTCTVSFGDHNYNSAGLSD